MENKIESGCQGNIFQFPRHHWRQMFKSITIDVYKGQDIMIMGVTNLFIHINMQTKKYGKEMVIMKVTVMLVNILLELGSDTYSKHVVFENGKKDIRVVLLREINIILVASMLFIHN